MRRKVIQIADSTQLVSLPRPWAKKMGLKKGDELEVEAKGNKIEISTEKSDVLRKIKLNVDGLDRSSIIYYIRSAYRKGFDIMEVEFSDQLVPHYRVDKHLKVISVIHQEVNRLVGMEVVTQKENYCEIKDISQSSTHEFDNILRRVFLLLLDAAKDFTESARNNDLVLTETIEEKHDTITNFISYCLRILNREGYSDPENLAFMFYVISILDRITDYYKYAARDVLEYKKKINKDTIKAMDRIHKSLEMYYDMYYKFELKKVNNLYKNRDKVIRYINSLSRKVPAEELLILSKLAQVLDLIIDITCAKTSMSLKFTQEES